MATADNKLDEDLNVFDLDVLIRIFDQAMEQAVQNGKEKVIDADALHPYLKRLLAPHIAKLDLLTYYSQCNTEVKELNPYHERYNYEDKDIQKIAACQYIMMGLLETTRDIQLKQQSLDKKFKILMNVIVNYQKQQLSMEQNETQLEHLRALQRVVAEGINIAEIYTSKNQSELKNCLWNIDSLYRTYHSSYLKENVKPQTMTFFGTIKKIIDSLYNIISGKILLTLFDHSGKQPTSAEQKFRQTFDEECKVDGSISDHAKTRYHCSLM